MKRMYFWMLMILLFAMSAGIISAVAQSSGLPQLAKDLPDPAETLGSPGEVYDEHYDYEGKSYRTYLYEKPGNVYSFLTAYTTVLKSAGFRSEQTGIEGYKVLKIRKPLKKDETALLFYDYQGYMLLMIPLNWKIGSAGDSGSRWNPVVPMSISTPVPTRKPTAAPTRKPTPVPTRKPTPKPTKIPTKTPRPTEAPHYYTGQLINFGYYEGSSIQWQVLHVQRDRILVMSKYGLEARAYNNTDRDVTWETCTLRSWLNDTFYNHAFTTAERGRIIKVRNSNPGNAQFGTYGGNDTEDRIYILSVNEVEHYMPSESSRRCAPLPRVKSKVKVYDGFSYWWLRTPTYYNGGASVIFTDGRIDYNANVGNSGIMVRPVMWIKR